MNIPFLCAHVCGDISEILRKLVSGKRQAAYAAARVHGYNAAALVQEKFLPARVACPCCGWQGRSFRAVDDESTVFYNLQCPSCDSSGRHRFMRLYLNTLAKDSSKSVRLLQIAPEACLLRFLTDLPGLRLFLTDLMPAKLAPHNQPKFRTDLRRMAVKSGSMDCAVCVHVLEHIDDDRQAVQEIFRIIKPGGQAFFMVPLGMELKETCEHDPAVPFHFGHLRVYSPASVPARLAPFQVESIYPGDHFSREEQSRFGIKDYDVIFLARK